MPKIPAYTIVVTDRASKRVVVQQLVADGPTNDERSLVDYQYGEDWERVRARLKTSDTGMVDVVFRWKDAQGKIDVLHVDAKPGAHVDVEKPAAAGGNVGRFRVEIQNVPEAQWKTAEALAFLAPTVDIRADAGGWHIKFTPHQFPCVCTVAVEGATKPEALPSIPFPSNMGFAHGTLYLPRDQFGAVPGALIRLGVRGAGMAVRVKLPDDGGKKAVRPATFDHGGVPNAELMTDAYVQAKYQENAALVQQFIVYGA